jgi:hypothetical protein
VKTLRLRNRTMISNHGWLKHCDATETPLGIFLFAGEQHGFREAANIKWCVDAEPHILCGRGVPCRTAMKQRHPG